MGAIRKIRRRRNGLLYPSEVTDSEAEAGSRGWNIRGWFLVFVFSSILLGLLGLRSEMKKNTKVFGDRPIASSQTASAVMPDNTVVGESPTSVPAPTTNTNAVIRTVNITLRPRLSSGTN